MSLYEKEPRWVEVDTQIYVAHWNSTTVAEDTDIKIMQELLQGLIKRCETRVNTLHDELVNLGEKFDKPMLRIFESHNPEKRMEWVQAKKQSRMLTNVVMNLRREIDDTGLTHFKFAVHTSIPKLDPEWHIRHKLMSDLFNMIAFQADNVLDKKAAEEEAAENGLLPHERAMYFMHMKGVRDSMERLVSGHDQWNRFTIKL